MILQVTQCLQCQQMNKKLDIVRPELFPVPVKSPWYHVGMDFVGPISPASRNGNRFILTISDYFTKFAWAKALPTKEALNVVSAVKEVGNTDSCMHAHYLQLFVAFLCCWAAICANN